MCDKLADRTAIEKMPTCLQKASGKEVKLAKPFIIWLGPWKGITDQIFGVHPLIGSERYLGRGNAYLSHEGRGPLLFIP